jgi:capsular exopolysaccharide synthesis family protein
MDTHTSNTANQESLFVKILAKYLPYWPLFILFAFLSILSALLYLRYSTPMFQATASLIIKDEKKGNEDSKLMESLNMISAKKIIENEIEVLKSRTVIDTVVKKLHLYAPVYKKGKVRDMPLYSNSPLQVEALNLDSIPINEEKFFFRVDKNSGVVRINDTMIFAIGEWVDTKYGKLKFTPSIYYIDVEPDKPYYFLLLDKKRTTENILDNLKVTATNKLSSVIDLRYRDKLPTLSEDILNEIITAYNNVLISEKNALAKTTLAFIESRLAIVGSDLDLIESKIQQYKGSSGAVDIGAQGQIFLQNVGTNDQRISDLEMQLSVIDLLEFQISQDDNNTGILPASLGVSDPTLSQLVNSLHASQLEREKLKKTVAENNPILVSVNDQIAVTKRRIIENIESYRRGIESSKQSLDQANSTYRSMLHSIPMKERELLEISRDKSIKSDIYSFLLQKREESELSYASKITDSRVVNYAQAFDLPVSPNRMLVFSALFVAIFAFPIGLVGARETLNTTILFRQDIESLTAIPIIGELMFNKSGKPLVVESGKRSYSAEEFRKIRYALNHRGIGHNRKTVLITSSISGEGKSYVAANLAISFSLTGKRVVLVDLDLHNSSLGEIFSFAGGKGVTDYLTGDADLSTTITPITGYENLFFLNAGTLRSDPSELLANGKIENLIQKLENQFDVVVIDTAPAILVTDAHMLSQLCSLTVYVVRHDYSPKSLLKRIDINSKTTPLKDPVIIFNGIKTRGYLNTSYGFGYSYGYVYGDAYNLKNASNRPVLAS